MAGEPRGIVATGPLTSATRAGVGWIQVFGKGAALRKRLLARAHGTGAVTPTRNHTRASSVSTPHESAS